MAVLTLTNDADGSGFVLTECSGWRYIYLEAPWSPHGLAVVNVKTGELINVRESVGEFFKRRKQAPWRIDRVITPKQLDSARF